MRILNNTLAATLSVLCVHGAGAVENLDSPATPDNTAGAMYSLEAIYDRLASGTEGSVRGTGFGGPLAAPGDGDTGHTLNEAMGVAPVVDDINGAVAADVVAGKTFWGLRSTEWGSAGANGDGTMVDSTEEITPDGTEKPITAGYHDGTGEVAGDTDLIAGNIASGITIFNVAGTILISRGDAVAAEVRADKTFSNATGSSIAGAMPVVAPQTFTVGTADTGILHGYHDGSETVAGDSNLVATNIVEGSAIFGVVGSAKPEPTGNALATEVLAGVTFSTYIGGNYQIDQSGTMANNGAVALTPTTVNLAIAAGYHNGLGSVAGDSDLVSGNIVDGVILYDGTAGEIVGAAVDPTGTTVAAMVLEGKTFSTGTLINQPGTMPNRAGLTITPAATNQAIPDGYHDGTSKVAADADLTGGNLRYTPGGPQIQVFGVAASDPDVVDTSSGDAAASDIALGKKAWVDGAELTGSAVAPPPVTGQTDCYDQNGIPRSCIGTGEDGEFQMGVPWPSPRFADNVDGTVTDNRSGLVWLADADCFLDQTWTNALLLANALYDGRTALPGADCGLSDGSAAGDWRLPNVLELASLIDFHHYNPTLPAGHPFLNVVTTVGKGYWTSTNSYNTGNSLWSNAWVLDFRYGSGSSLSKADSVSQRVWVVRDPL